MPTVLPVLSTNQTAVFGPYTFKFGADLVLYVQWPGLNSFLALRQLSTGTLNCMVTASDILDAKALRENPSQLPQDWLS